jgi:hypothetical protein
MGCDIHAYIELRNKEFSSVWRNFGSRFSLPRHYGVFARLAGVRAEVHSEQIVPRRGMPDDAAFLTVEDNELTIINDPAHKDYCDGHHVYDEIAEKWVASGASKKTGKDRITHPDWHSHTWVTPAEFAKAIRTQHVASEYKAFLSAMRSLEKDGNEVRAVIWFDC